MIGIEIKYEIKFEGSYIRNKEEIKEILQNLKDCDVMDFMLLSRDGTPLAYSIQNSRAHMDTVATMAATMCGAADAANSELRKKMPTYTRLDSGDAETLFTRAGDRHVLLVSGKQGLEKQIKNILEIAQKAVSKLD
jgi:predicted regulator of Ras-like GTPase activity (Roadblock/LC7/MglB family)